jgi:hypothetical protein
VRRKEKSYIGVCICVVIKALEVLPRGLFFGISPKKM